MQITSALEALAKIEPLTLAILFIGLISVGVIGLATILVKAVFKNKK